MLCASAVFAGNAQNAHGLAEQFANAHKTKPSKNPAPDKIKPSEVQGAVQMQSQEAEMKSTDALLDSIEARTKAIEDLLKRTEPQPWDVQISSPDVSQPQTPAQSLPGARITDRIGPTAPATTKDVFELPQPSYALGRSAAQLSGLTEASDIMTKATVLLKMTPGEKGLRRFKKTADPVLCGRRYCYTSQGKGKNALRLERGATLGPFNTLGHRAGACRQKLICVFRGVDVAKNGVLLQPIDLKFLRHDRRAYRSIKADETCKVSGGRLHCAKPIVAKSWTAWVVPEHVAREAGDDSLKTALQDGLPHRPLPTIQVHRSN